MDKLLNELISEYNKLDDRVVNYLQHVINEINISEKNVSDYTKVVLSMLVPQLIIYYRSLDDLNDNDELTNENKYYGKSKSPVILIMQKANDQILNLLDKISLSPLSRAKIKKLNTTEENNNASGANILSTLMGNDAN